jgi:spore coat protein Y
MSCKKHDSSDNCVCDAVRNILAQQDAVEEQCTSSCFSNLLAPIANGADTIPFILYTKKGTPFSAFGGFSPTPQLRDTFRTPFFRVRDLDDCCATLELLEPIGVPEGQDCEADIERIICRTDSLRRSNFCIEVDLDCFCAIQCFNPTTQLTVAR